MSIHKQILFITSVVISTLLIKTPEVFAEHIVVEPNINNNKHYIYEPSTPLGGFSLVLEEYYENLEQANELYEPEIVSLSISKENYIELEVPCENSFKSYMSYKAITDKTSRQYKLQQSATTDEYGLRKIDDRYCIAVGTYYGDVGEEIDVVMKNGAILECIISDIKDDRDTNNKNQKHKVDGSVVEFVVDTKKLDRLVKKMGDISYINEMFSGEIAHIRKYE